MLSASQMAPPSDAGLVVLFLMNRWIPGFLQYHTLLHLFMLAQNGLALISLAR